MARSRTATAKNGCARARNMKVLFGNAPWFDNSDQQKPRCGIRAGSRWPHTIPLTSIPGEFRHGKYLPYPFFMGYAATYAAKHTDATVLFRDSIARHETYQRFFEYLLNTKPDLIFMECATPSWAHDKALILQIQTLLPLVAFAITGTICSVRADEIMQIPGVVAAIKGEYEKNAVKVINATSFSGIFENDLLTPEEMNAAPFPY